MSGHPESDLGVYVLGVLPGEASTRLRLHLESCAECRARVGDLEGTSELLSAARLAPEAPPGLVEAALASLPPRRTETERAAGGGGGGGVATVGGVAGVDGVGGDFVIGHREQPAGGAHRGRTLVAAAAVVTAALVGAVVAWTLAAGSGDSAFALTALDTTASGTVRRGADDAGTSLLLHAVGLATGSYTVDVGGHTAGSFRSADGTADVELHTSASAGHLEVRRDPDAVVVLEADLP